jgi:hypothetical protein
MIKTVIQVESPRDHVYSVFTNYGKYRDWLPGCEKSEVVSTNGNVSELDIVVNSMKRISMVLRFEAVPTQVLNFKLVKGSDMKGYSGSYRLLDAADGRGTVVMAELDIDAGPLAPKFLVDRMAKKAVDDTGNALRTYIKTLPPPGKPAGGFTTTMSLKVRPRRAKRVLEVVRTPQGYSISYLGQQYTPRS